MKPRLESAEETAADVLMWLKLARRIQRRDQTATPVRFRCLSLRSIVADRRDADLMYKQSALPGFACIQIELDDGSVIQHNIAGRKERERCRDFRRAHPQLYGPELYAWCEARELL